MRYLLHKRSQVRSDRKTCLWEGNIITIIIIIITIVIIAIIIIAVIIIAIIMLATRPWCDPMRTNLEAKRNEP